MTDVIQDGDGKIFELQASTQYSTNQWLTMQLIHQLCVYSSWFACLMCFHSQSMQLTVIIII